MKKNSDEQYSIEMFLLKDNKIYRKYTPSQYGSPKYYEANKHEVAWFNQYEIKLKQSSKMYPFQFDAVFKQKNQYILKINKKKFRLLTYQEIQTYLLFKNAETFIENSKIDIQSLILSNDKKIYCYINKLSKRYQSIPEQYNQYIKYRANKDEMIKKIQEKRKHYQIVFLTDIQKFAFLMSNSQLQYLSYEEEQYYYNLDISEVKMISYQQLKRQQEQLKEFELLNKSEQTGKIEQKCQNKDHINRVKSVESQKTEKYPQLASQMSSPAEGQAITQKLKQFQSSVQQQIRKLTKDNQANFQNLKSQSEDTISRLKLEAKYKKEQYERQIELLRNQLSQYQSQNSKIKDKLSKKQKLIQKYQTEKIQSIAKMQNDLNIFKRDLENIYQQDLKRQTQKYVQPVIDKKVGQKNTRIHFSSNSQKQRQLQAKIIHLQKEISKNKSAQKQFEQNQLKSKKQQQMQKKILALTDINDKLSDDIKHYSEQIIQIKLQNKIKIDQIEERYRKYSQINKSKQIKQKQSQLQKSVQKLNQKKSQYKKKLQETQFEMSQIKDENTKLQIRVGELRSNLSELKKKSDKNSLLIATILQFFSHRKVNLKEQNLLQAIKSLFSQRDNLNSKQQQLKMKQSQLRANRQKIRQYLTRANQKSIEINKIEPIKVDQNSQQIEVSINTLLHRFKSKIEQMKNRQEAMIAQNNSSVMKIKKLQDQVKLYMNISNQRQLKIKTQSNELLAFSANARLQNELIEQKDSQVQQLKTTIIHLIDQIQSFNKRYSLLQQKFNSHQKKYNQKFGTMETKIKNLKMSLKDQKSVRDEKQQKFQKKLKSIVNLIDRNFQIKILPSLDNIHEFLQNGIKTDTNLSVSPILEKKSQERIFLCNQISQFIKSKFRSKLLFKFDQYNKNIANYLPLKSEYSFVVLIKTKNQQIFGFFAQNLPTRFNERPRLFAFNLLSRSVFRAINRVNESMNSIKADSNYLILGNSQIRIKFELTSEMIVNSKVFGQRYFDFTTEKLTGTVDENKGNVIFSEFQIHRIYLEN